MRFFANCFTFANCFQQQQDDDEQTFADQLDPPSSSHSKVKQPEPRHEHEHEPDPELVSELQLTSTPKALLKSQQQLELEVELELEEPELLANTLRPKRPTPSATALRGSHSPARLEQISICADVHPSQLPPELPASTCTQQGKVAGERYSGVAIKDEIEIFTDVDLGNGAHYFAF